MFYTLRYGKYSDLTIEEVALKDYEAVLDLLEKAKRNSLDNNQVAGTYQSELEKVIEICNIRLVGKFDCPVCKAKKVRYLSVRFSSDERIPSISSNYCCCEDDECQSFYRVVGSRLGSIEFIPLQISKASRFSGKHRKQFIKTLKFLVGVDRLDRQGIEKLFYSNT